MRQWKLLSEDDAGKTIVVPLTRDVITIGRKEGNTIRLTERNVSRFHARLSRDAGTLYVEDLESYNGIKLNGDRIKGRVEISDGDLIEIGDYHLALQTEGAAEPAPATGPGPRRPLDEHEYEEVDDQFAGDTQRWEPPSPSSPDPGGQTMQDQSPLTPPTQPAQPVIAQSASAPGFENEATANQHFNLADATIPMPNAPFGDSGPGPITPLNPSMPTEAGSALPESHSASDPSMDPEPMLPAAPLLDEATEAVSRAPVLADPYVDQPRLVALNTRLAGDVYPLDGEEIVMGRVDCDLVLDHRSVSRSHSKLVRHGDTFRILDLKSSNGVLLNGEEVDDVALKAGDVLELGRVQLRFVPAGERFALSAEDVELAHAADVAGADGGDEITGSLSALPSEPRGKNPIAIAAGVVLVAAVGIGGYLFYKGSGPTDKKPVIRAPDTKGPTSTGPSTTQPDPNAGQLAVKVDDPVATDPAEDPPEDPPTDPKVADAQKAKDPEAAKKPLDHTAEKARALKLEKAGQLAEAKGVWQALQKDGNLEAGEALARLDELEQASEGVEAVKAAYAKKRYRDVVDLAAAFEAGSASAKQVAPIVAKAKRYGARDAYKTGTKAVKRGKAKSAKAALTDLEAFSPGSKQAKDLAKRLKKLERQRARASSRATPRDDGDKEEATGPTPEDRKQAKELVANGVRKFMFGDSAEAEAILLEAKELDPFLPEIYKNLGLVYERTGKADKAIKNFRKYLSLNRYARDRSQIEVKIKGLEGK